MWFITIALGALIIYLVNYWVNSYFNDWKARGIPYSPSSSPFKMIYQFIFTKKGLLEILVEDYERMEGHRYAGFFQMLTPGILIRDVDLVHRICIKDFSHFVDRSLPASVSDFFSESLGSLTGDRWRTVRHKITPTFTSGKLKMMFKPIQECCDEAVEFIDKKNGQDIEVRDFGLKYTISVIGNVAFGLKVNALNEETEKENEFLNVSRLFFQPSFMLVLKFMITITMPKVRKYIRFTLVDDKVVNFFNKLVKDIIAHREKTGEVRNDFLQLLLDEKKKEQSDSSADSLLNMKGKTKHSAEEPEDKELLDQLKNMESNNQDYKSVKVFTDDCIVSQSFLFISGGSETTASALSFVLYELAVNPDCQKKLQHEVDEAISKNGFTYTTIRNMKYMEQVLQESLRMHPIAPFLSRICAENYKIPDSDVVIEKGTFVSLPVVGINRDPQFFPEPQKFNPDRFEDMDSINPGIFLSFGAGPRMCIAKRLAIQEIKMLLASIMQRYTVKLSPRTKMPLKLQKASVFQHVEGGIWINFEKRN